MRQDPRNHDTDMPARDDRMGTKRTRADASRNRARADRQRRAQQRLRERGIINDDVAPEGSGQTPEAQRQVPEEQKPIETSLERGSAARRKPAVRRQVPERTPQKPKAQRLGPEKPAQKPTAQRRALGKAAQTPAARQQASENRKPIAIPAEKKSALRRLSGKTTLPIWSMLIVFAAALTMLGVGVASIVGSDGVPRANSSSNPSAGIDPEDVDDVDHEEGMTHAAPADLAWRDEDFAVDPTRTDWNYESNGRKVVYLTIDDGPSENTEAVLDILDKYDCKATFFVVGQDPAYYDMIGEAYRRGHTIGMHTYSHDYAEVYASTEAYYADLDKIAAIVEEQIGYVPCFIRFPGGSSNTMSAQYCPGIMTTLTQEVQEQGYQYYDWNMSVGDGDVHTTDEIIGYATEPTELENIVLLCHDAQAKKTTVEALPKIIEHYQSLGYTFEAIDRTTLVPHHEVDN